MPKFQIGGTALGVGIIAAAIGFTLLTGPFALIASIAGLSAGIVLLAYDREGSRNVFESLAYAAVVSLCFTLAAEAPFRYWASSHQQPAAFENHIGGVWLPLFWLGLTIALWIIDSMRMSARVHYPAAPVPVVAQSVSPLIRAATPSVETPAEKPAPRATFTRPSFAQVTPERAPEEPKFEPVSAAERAPSPAVEAPPAVPAPPPVPVPAGKETMIYVTLVGEGLNVLRAVRAEHLGRDFYKISEPMPEGEVWQFGPGQIVRCKKKNLSSGKAMVAIEEAPRAR